MEWGKAAARHLAARRSRPCLVSCVGCGARGRFSGPMSMARGEGRGPTSFLVSRRARHPPAFRADSAAPHARHTALSARPSAPRAAQLTLTRSPGQTRSYTGAGGGGRHTRPHRTANHGPNLAADRTCSRTCLLFLQTKTQLTATSLADSALFNVCCLRHFCLRQPALRPAAGPGRASPLSPGPNSATVALLCTRAAEDGGWVQVGLSGERVGSA